MVIYGFLINVRCRTVSLEGWYVTFRGYHAVSKRRAAPERRTETSTVPL